MARKVKWNKRAVNQLDGIVNYLESKDANKGIRTLITDIDELLEKISKYPEIGRKSKKFKTIRQFKINKNLNLYYRRNGNTTIVVYLFDRRMNPEKNKFK